MKRLRLPLLLLGLVTLVTWSGCDSQADEIFKRAYDASYSSGYLETIQSGRDLGLEEGTQHGDAEARRAAENGVAWQLYWIPVSSLLLTGLALGLMVQYTILLICRRTANLPQFSAVAFVPAMKFTVAYKIFERRRNVMIEIDEKLREMAKRKNLQIAKIEQLKETVALKVETMSSLDELTQSRLLELAAKEMDKVIAKSTKKARPGKRSSKSGANGNLTHPCPACRTKNHYHLRLAGKTVKCSNKECGRAIKLPPIFPDVDDMEPILEI